MSATPDAYRRLRDDFRWELPAQFNIGISCSDRQRPDGLAVVDLGDGMPGVRREVTFDMLREWSNRLAHSLAAAGVGRGDRVAVALPQSVETIVAHFGIFKAGAVPVPVAAEIDAAHLGAAVIDSDSRVVITDADREEVVRAALPEGRFVLVVGGVIDEFWAFLAGGSALDPQMLTDRDEPALLFYPAGERPRGVLHAHRVLPAALPGFDLAFGVSPNAGPVAWTPADWAQPGPLLGLILPTLWRGGTVVAALPPLDYPPSGATAMWLPADSLARLVETTAPPSPRPTGVVVDGPADERFATRAGELFGPLHRVYGPIEAGFLAGDSARWPAAPGTVGRPYPGHDLYVVDPAGRPVGPGVEGEIAVAADDPAVLLEYWERPADTATAVRDGLLLTGDRGMLTEDGSLRLAD